MAKKLYVGNLPYSVTNESLQEMFSKFGNVVSAVIIYDRVNRNRSKGFGFVEFDTDEAAAAALEQMNGADLEGRKVSVSEAREMTPRGPSDNNYRGNSNPNF